MTRKRIREDRRIADSQIVKTVDLELWVYHTTVLSGTCIRSAGMYVLPMGDLPILHDDIGW